MQKVLCVTQAEECIPYIGEVTAERIRSGQVVAFEAMADHDFIAFDWYDVNYAGTDTSRVLIYMDGETLLFFGENQEACEKIQEIVIPGEKNEWVLYHFFTRLLQEDLSYLEEYESEITDAEDAALKSARQDYMGKIVEYRKELLRLKRYYEQLNAIFDNLASNDNGLLSEDAVRHFVILSNRTERYHSSVVNLRDYVTQMREAYQARMEMEQSNLMRVFTVVTAVFLPLSLLVGWYGMNFRTMPELSWKYGYPVFILSSLLICIGLIWYFKKKKWL